MARGEVRHPRAFVERAIERGWEPAPKLDRYPYEARTAAAGDDGDAERRAEEAEVAKWLARQPEAVRVALRQEAERLTRAQVGRVFPDRPPHVLVAGRLYLLAREAMRQTAKPAADTSG